MPPLLLLLLLLLDELLLDDDELLLEDELLLDDDELLLDELAPPAHMHGSHPVPLALHACAPVEPSGHAQASCLPGAQTVGSPLLLPLLAELLLLDALRPPSPPAPSLPPPAAAPLRVVDPSAHAAVISRKAQNSPRGFAPKVNLLLEEIRRSHGYARVSRGSRAIRTGIFRAAKSHGW